jgi:hypothetical protein
MPRLLSLSCRVVFCLVLVSCLVLSCLVLSCLVLSCLVLSWLGLAWLGLAWLGLAWLVLSCLVLSCPVLSCRVLSCLHVSCLWLWLVSSCLFGFGFSCLVFAFFVLYNVVEPMLTQDNALVWSCPRLIVPDLLSRTHCPRLIVGCFLSLSLSLSCTHANSPPTLVLKVEQKVGTEESLAGLMQTLVRENSDDQGRLSVCLMCVVFCLCLWVVLSSLLL